MNPNCSIACSPESSQVLSTLFHILPDTRHIFDNLSERTRASSLPLPLSISRIHQILVLFDLSIQFSLFLVLLFLLLFQFAMNSGDGFKMQVSIVTARTSKRAPRSEARSGGSVSRALSSSISKVG